MLAPFRAADTRVTASPIMMAAPDVGVAPVATMPSLVTAPVMLLAATRLAAVRVLVAPEKVSEPMLAMTQSEKERRRGGYVSPTHIAARTAPAGASHPSSCLLSSDRVGKGVSADGANMTVGGHA